MPVCAHAFFEYKISTILNFFYFVKKPMSPIEDAASVPEINKRRKLIKIRRKQKRRNIKRRGKHKNLVWGAG